MIKIQEPQKYGRVTESGIRDFETRHQVFLPEDYQRFLLETNGGVPAPSGVVFEEHGSWTDTDVQVFYGIHSGDEWAQLEWAITSHKNFIPHDTVPIANDSCGNAFLLKLYGPKSGTVYFWDHESSSGPEDLDALSYVAPSFSVFLSGLVDLTA